MITTDSASPRRRSYLHLFFVALPFFFLTSLLIFLGLKLFLPSSSPDESNYSLLFSDSFSPDERDFYASLLEPISLTSDLFLEKQSSTQLNDGLLTDILLPTTDFYDPAPRISASELLSRYDAGTLVSIFNLTPSYQLMSVDGEYYLDTFSSGAIFETIKLSSDSTEDVKQAESIINSNLGPFPTADSTLTFAQTGVTALARNYASRLAQVGDATYFAAEIGPFLSSFDLTHTSNESSFSIGANANNICSNWAFVDTLAAIGLDIVELTGNHNLDCGADSALETLTKYSDLGIKTVGGGSSATTAAVPLELHEKGTNITFLAYNESTGGATTGNTPGANQYSETDAKSRILEAKSRGDTIIVDIQYYECNSYADTNENTTCDRADSSAGDQVGLFHSLIDFGADIVVGTSAHQPQTYEHYHGGEIFYGLGNLLFDQYWWPGTSRSIVLVHYFWNNKLVQTRRFGTTYDAALQPRLMTDDELTTFLTRLNEAR